MNKVILTVGAPASGKSTWAREYARETGAVIVERDAIRATYGFTYSEPKEQIAKNERFVTKVQRGQIEAALADGNDVIVSDTNLNKQFRDALVKYIHQLGADVEYKLFTDVPLNELMKRDAARSDAVGADVVAKFYHQAKGITFLPNEPVVTYAPYAHQKSGVPAYVVDFDGTIAIGDGHRSPYDYHKVIDDEPFADVLNTVKSLARSAHIIGVSGRDDSCFADTQRWAWNQGLNLHKLYMRKTGDKRPDWMIKNEIYDTHIIPHYNILGVFDDRDQVVRHLRARGITVFQVNYGRF